MGDARQEKVSTVLDRASRSAVFKILNEGEPLKMGISLGVTEEEAISKMKNYKIFVNIVIISLSAIRKKYLIKWN
jgi:hypothetical protein